MIFIFIRHKIGKTSSSLIITVIPVLLEWTKQNTFKRETSWKQIKKNHFRSFSSLNEIFRSIFFTQRICTLKFVRTNKALKMRQSTFHQIKMIRTSSRKYVVYLSRGMSADKKTDDSIESVFINNRQRRNGRKISV